MELKKIIISAVEANAKFATFIKNNYISRTEVAYLTAICLAELGLLDEASTKEASKVIYNFLNDSQLRQAMEKDVELKALGKWRQTTSDVVDMY